jgi:hypothetical protein
MTAIPIPACTAAARVGTAASRAAVRRATRALSVMSVRGFGMGMDLAMDGDVYFFQISHCSNAIHAHLYHCDIP